MPELPEKNSDGEQLFLLTPTCKRDPNHRSLADLRGRQGRVRPWGSKFFNFHAVFGKKICKIIPIWELAHPPRENPGSATVGEFNVAQRMF